MLSVGQFLSRHTASLILSLSTVSIAAIAANPGFFLGGLLFAGTYATSTMLLKHNQKKESHANSRYFKGRIQTY